MEVLLSFLRHIQKPLCGPCVSTLLGNAVHNLVADLLSLEGAGRVFLEVATCPGCGELAPTYRLA